jgi:antitoxin component of MazEF toxin-antitoxin module
MLNKVLNMETIQKTTKIGGSVMVRIPKDIIELEQIKPGEMVKLNIQKFKKSWFGAFPKLTDFNKKEDRLHTLDNDNT